MSGLGMVWARQQRVGHPGAKSLLLLLAEVSNEQGETYQNQQYFADILEVSRETVVRNMSVLETKGLIVRRHRSRPGGKGRLSDQIIVQIGAQFPSDESSHKGVDQCEDSGQNPPDQCDISSQLVNNTQLLNNEPLSSDADAPTQKTFDPIVHKLCEYLAEWIERNTGKRPSIGVQWLEACERLMRIDGRTPDKIKACIDWCQSNEFWQGNILSMPKLREKYNQLALAAQAERQRLQRQAPAAASTKRVEAGNALVQALEAREEELGLLKGIGQ